MFYSLGMLTYIFIWVLYTPLVVTTVKPELIKLLFMYLQRARERMNILSHESNVYPVYITVLPLLYCHNPLFTDRPCVITH